MRKTIFILFILTAGCFAEEGPSKKEELAKISEAMGHLIGKNLESLGLPLDLDALVRGIQQAALGKDSPLSEEDCIEALSQLQEESLLKEAANHLNEAAQFLLKNKEKNGVVTIADGKVQYEVTKEGFGPSIEMYNKPLVRYSGKYLNGSMIAKTEEILDLEETIPGFQKGILGMKEGEVRTLYIHPELGYQDKGQISPNSLLIFEVEAVKADAKEAMSPDGLPSEETEKVRF